MEKLERTLNDVETDLGKEPEEASEKPKKVKKVAKAKKSVKKVAKKANGKSAAKSDSDGKVTLAELCGEAGITTAAARRKLRDAELSREGRWAWEPGSKSLKDARKALGIE